MEQSIKLCECGCGAAAPLAKQTSARRGHTQGQPVRFIKGHAARLQAPALRVSDPAVAEHFWAKVNKTPGQGPNGDCWEWLGARLNGYGLIGLAGRTLRANRVAYFLTKGEIPEGLFVCHSCDNPPCCNPAHLRADTPKGNRDEMVSKGRGKHANARKTACKRGHEFTPENTRINVLGRRICITCDSTVRRPPQRERERAKRNNSKEQNTALPQ